MDDILSELAAAARAREQAEGWGTRAFYRSISDLREETKTDALASVIRPSRRRFWKEAIRR